MSAPEPMNIEEALEGVSRAAIREGASYIAWEEAKSAFELARRGEEDAGRGYLQAQSELGSAIRQLRELLRSTHRKS
jgi:hypothetical protein